MVGSQQICLYKSEGLVTVWRRTNTELDPKNMVVTEKHEDGSVMVWDCMASSGVGELVFIDGIIDKIAYKKIFEGNLKKIIRKQVLLSAG